MSVRYVRRSRALLAEVIVPRYATEPSRTKTFVIMLEAAFGVDFHDAKALSTAVPNPSRSWARRKRLDVQAVPTAANGPGPKRAEAA